MSPGYDAPIVTVPMKPLFGVKVTEQVPDERVQLAEGVNVPEPGGVCVNETVPVGVEAMGAELSATVMTQLVGVFGVVLAGLQTTVVVVVRWVACRVVCPLLE